MCGIIGYFGFSDYKDYVLSGLKLLQNRGYDSAGVSIIHEKTIKTIKFASTTTNDAVELLESEINKYELTSNLAIGHTRWATHGKKTDENAHPHHDNKNRISLVHNGIIENYHDLKTELIEEGYFFTSETDTEVVSVLIGKYLDKDESVDQAIRIAIGRLTGTWALIIIHKDYDKLWVAKNGLPILLGFHADFIMVASEQIAFSNFVKRYAIVDDHDIVEINNNQYFVTNSEIEKKYSVIERNNETIELFPTGHKHWLIKEILEQPESIRRATFNRIDENQTINLPELEPHKNRLLEMKHLILLGCGTSYHAGLWSMDIFKELDIFDTVSIFDGAEFSEKDIPKSGNVLAVLLSQSGETKDLYDCLPLLRRNDIVTMGVINVEGSLISRETDCSVYIRALREVSVASTKSFTNQCIILSMIAVWLSQQKIEVGLEKRNEIVKDLMNLNQDLEECLSESIVSKIRKIAKNLKLSKTVFVLGKRQSYAIALESCLKIKEVSYIHAEGYNSSALKHGPFALIYPRLPIILLDIDDAHRSINHNTLQELSARDARVIRISNDDSGELRIPNNKSFAGLLANSYIQLLSYYIAVELGHNPDFPKNLAKVVTVL
jgi:glucosamine--fructose-6-phosphate aminotransferase (isomerizing)